MRQMDWCTFLICYRVVLFIPLRPPYSNKCAPVRLGRSGDKLEFKVGDASAGTFSVSDLPNNDAVLLLVIHRHDTLSTAVSFESHVFASLQNAQVAIIDTYKADLSLRPDDRRVHFSGVP